MERRDVLKSGAALATLAGAMPLTAREAEAAPASSPQGPAGKPLVPLGSAISPKPPLPIAGDTSYPPIVAMTRVERERRNAVPARGMCSTAPGTPFRETLISGSGAMLFELTGHPWAEELLFHHERLMLPWRRPFEAPKVADALPHIRKLLLDGKYREGADYAFQAMTDAGLQVNTKAHPTIPAFAMRIETPAAGAARDYLRTLDFESGEMQVAWRDDKGAWRRRAFASRPDNVLVQQLAAPDGGALDLSIALHQPTVGRHEGPVTFAFVPGTDRLVFTGRFDPSVNGNGYAGVVRVIRDGGSAAVEGDRLTVRGARSVTLLTRIDWFEDFDQHQVDALAHGLDGVVPDYAALLKRQRDRQAGVVGRVAVDFGGAAQRWMSNEELLTDQRTRPDYAPALLERILDMGRYWLFVSSGTFPVQPMAGEVNININLQVSHGTIGDVPEAMAAYHDWVESLLPDCRNNARNIFGARGAVYPVLPNKGIGVSFHYARTEGAGVWPHPYWTAAGGWLYSPFWDHYLVTGDMDFLRDRIVPGLKELAAFYEDFLTVEDERGNYVFVPSFSPENWPLNAEPLPPPVWPLTIYDAYHMAPPAPFVVNAAMDVMVCREVLTHLIEACETLGTDVDGVARWRAMLAKMPPYRTTADGTLKEWGWPGLDENYDQRHVSHLYGAWPSDEIDPDTTPELAHAALLADRKRGPANTSAHGLLHRALAGARLKDRYIVDYELKRLLNEGYFNTALRSSHNPYNGPMPDAQGGVPSIIMEMLCATRAGRIELLPALPEALRKGSLRGIRARTFARIDTLAWDLDARRIDLAVNSLRDQQVVLVVRHGIDRITAVGAVVEPVKSGSQSTRLSLRKGAPATLTVTLSSDRPRSWTAARPV
ncbi:MAG TPA: glycoside hydrolase N-terminal domain-containing protein [Sphingomonas sp.]|nr:glycoside hydrolase N-terminal domain-containing protein [Sphingomonas sp.]